MRRLLLAGAAAALLLAVGAGAGWLSRPPRLDVRLYAQNRLAAIQAHLDEAGEGYTLIAGDSQAELQSPSVRFCGAEVVNAGISGATASAYAGFLADLSFPIPPRRAVLTLGTNDANRKHAPASEASSARFVAAVEEIVARLRTFGAEVTVTAVPPVGREIEALVDAQAARRYGARLSALCARAGCTYADPFASLREADTDFARAGTMRFGLHLLRYRPVLDALEPVVCARNDRP